MHYPKGEKTEENVLRVRKEFIPYYDIHNADDSRPCRYFSVIVLSAIRRHSGAVASNKYQAATETSLPTTFRKFISLPFFDQREGVNVKPDPTIVFDIY